MYRDPNASRAQLVMFVFIAVFMGLIYLRLDYSNTASIQDRTGALFFASVFVMMMGLLLPFNTFATESKIFFKDYFAGLYGTVPYYISKFVGEAVTFTVMLFIYAAITYWMTGFNSSVGAFFTFCLIMILLANISIAFGTLLIAIFPNPATALNVFPMFFVPIMMFSGFYLNSDNVPVYFIWVEYLSFLKYGFRALMRNEFDDAVLFCTDEELQDFGGVCRFEGPGSGRQLLRFFSMLGVSSLWIDVAILCGYFMALHLLSVTILAFRARRQTMAG